MFKRLLISKVQLNNLKKQLKAAHSPLFQFKTFTICKVCKLANWNWSIALVCYGAKTTCTRPKFSHTSNYMYLEMNWFWPNYIQKWIDFRLGSFCGWITSPQTCDGEDRKSRHEYGKWRADRKIGSN